MWFWKLCLTLVCVICQLDWILPVPDDHRKAQCKYCGVKLSAYYAGLCSHAMDKKHMKNISTGGNAVGIRPLLIDHVDKEFCM